MAAGSQALEDDGSGGAAGGEGEGVLGVLESGHSGLEVYAIRVRRARVLILADWLAHGGLGECGGQRDRLDNGAGNGIVG